MYLCAAVRVCEAYWCVPLHLDVLCCCYTISRNRSLITSTFPLFFPTVFGSHVLLSPYSAVAIVFDVYTLARFILDTFSLLTVTILPSSPFTDTYHRRMKPPRSGWKTWHRYYHKFENSSPSVIIIILVTPIHMKPFCRFYTTVIHSRRWLTFSSFMKLFYYPSHS